MIDSRTCPIHGCRRPRNPHYLMCVQHWYAVPMERRRVVWQLWNNGKPRPGHRECVTRLIEDINARIAQARASEST
jgi:hypothetical protein